MKRVVAVAMIVAGLLAVGLLASRTFAVAVAEDNAAGPNVAPAGGDHAAPADTPKKEEPKKRVDPKVVMAASAMAAVEAAQKAMEEGNKEAALAELAKAKAAIQGLQKAMEPKPRKPVESKPEGDAKPDGEKKPDAGDLHKNMEMKSLPNTLPPHKAE
jgi:hypothetical protein